MEQFTPADCDVVGLNVVRSHSFSRESRNLDFYLNWPDLKILTHNYFTALCTEDMV